jgi:hypothetical protein
LLPVHWGTFNLALHAWDAPAEDLLRLAPARSVELLMPRLGQPIEPAQAGTVEPWWRAVAALERAGTPAPAESEDEAIAGFEPID